jgi:hypothetical protein
LCKKRLYVIDAECHASHTINACPECKNEVHKSTPNKRMPDATVWHRTIIAPKPLFFNCKTCLPRHQAHFFLHNPSLPTPFQINTFSMSGALTLQKSEYFWKTFTAQEMNRPPGLQNEVGKPPPVYYSEISEA